MILTKIKTFPKTPFSIELEPIENGPNHWKSTRVTILRDGNPIGVYLRNYHSQDDRTFYPFMAEGEWYALYSAKYTCTSVLKLHEDKIEDWCKEPDGPGGFCPVEFYVPRFNHFEYVLTNSTDQLTSSFRIFDCDDDADDEDETSPEYKYSGYTSFGFLSGCHWGDDHTWKVRYIDLKDIPRKILTITEKFGYHELPNYTTLKKCVDLNDWEEDYQSVKLTTFKSYRLDK